MYGYVLQDWITIRGATSVTSIAQAETDWLGLAPFQDLVVWLDCREVTDGGATAVQMSYETAPTKDDALFVNMLSAPFNLAASSSPRVDKFILALNPTVPLGRWVRWKLTLSGSATSSWDSTFRILCCANAIGLAG